MHLAKYTAGFLAMLMLSGGLKAQDAAADNMILFQRVIGGWSKEYKGKQPVDYKKTYEGAEREAIEKDAANKIDATIDNGATIKEIRYLIKAYNTTNNVVYKQAAEKGIRYLLKAQENNGGWPQFYPDSSSYRAQITYNDNAMTNVLNLLQDLKYGENEVKGLDDELVKAASLAIDRGIDCILKTQVVVNGKLTAWCAQHDRKTLQPVKARAFELASLSGMESVAITTFLIRQKQPTPEVKKAINAAIDWFKQVQINGYDWVSKPDATHPDGKDKVLEPATGNTLWARFYDLDTNQPFFCGRDGVKKADVKEIEHERRVGYAWYGVWPKNLLEKLYPEWQKKHA